MAVFTKKLALIPALAAVLLGFSCKSVPKFSDVRDKEWKLIAVRTTPENIDFDRNQLIGEGFGDIFTIQFADQVSGKGAPNRYFGPFEVGADQAMSIKNVAATLMAPIREPEKLKERDFFTYLQNTYHWTISKGNLELSTKGENGTDAVLVFVPE
jgi:heat shock protein HslJ